jgi:hypothetical protein
MAELDLARFADAVEAGLDGLSVRQAVAKWPETNVALWSRARRGRQPLSAANFLLVCAALDLDPFAFVKPEKVVRGCRRAPRLSLRGIVETLRNQTVTARVSREDRRAAP